MRTRQAFTKGTHYPNRPGGGRTWWAHFEFTRMNIEPTILHKQFEDLREAQPSSDKRALGPIIFAHIFSTRLK
jgi:hypothetical protein